MDSRNALEETPHWHENQLAYAELKRRAIDGIENGDVLQRSDGIRRMIVLHIFEKGRYPISFKGWTIYQHLNPDEPKADITYSLISAGWNWKADMKRSEQTSPSSFKPEPTWIIKQAPLEKEAVEARLQKASTIAMPIIGVRGHAGWDGTDYGLKWHGNSTGVSLYFWSSGPEEWKALVDWMRKLINYLDAELRKAARQRRQNMT
jgi:hypothetical protein